MSCIWSNLTHTTSYESGVFPFFFHHCPGRFSFILLANSACSSNLQSTNLRFINMAVFCLHFAQVCLARIFLGIIGISEIRFSFSSSSSSGSSTSYGWKNDSPTLLSSFTFGSFFFVFILRPNLSNFGFSFGGIASITYCVK